jgi:arylsulfatase A-like enzyme
VSEPVARVVAVGLALGAAWVAYHAGGGADARPLAPAAVRADDGSRVRRDDRSGAFQVSARLVEQVNEARIEAPNMAQKGPLMAHWRKMPVPWARLSPEGLKATVSIALRTSATETQWSMPTGKGQWEPSAHIWNMNEGSFDQREAIALPTPATVTFKVTVPANARLDFGTAVLGGRGETVFGVTVVDAHGHAKDVFTRATPTTSPTDAQKWEEGQVDLSPWAGQGIELKLRAVPKLMVTTKGGMSSLEPSASAIALWGNPTVLGKGPATLPYNVLWIVVDALRPDVIASFHDDEEDRARLHAKRPPLDALLPKVAGLTPSIDDLAARGVRFTHAYSSAAWTRPGTLAMLSGARSSELGVDPLPWVLTPEMAAHFYTTDPPLLPLFVRRAGAETRAFVNNYFIVGYAAVGLDLGFERVDDERYRTQDTQEITANTKKWLKAHASDRFFVFCNFDSPHDPYEPPAAMLARVPKPPAGPSDPMVRMYMAEAAKDDEAIGELMHALDELHLREQTLVVLTSDHGETLSSAHEGKSGIDKMPTRFHHAQSNYEETARVPILLSLPGVLPEGREVSARVRTVDIAPTVVELLGLEKSPKMSGASLLSLARGQSEPDERVVLTEGRGTRALMTGRWRYVAREGQAQTTYVNEKPVIVTDELYDLEDDPGERHNLAKDKPDVVAEMRARLEAAKKNVAVAGTQAAARPDSLAPDAAPVSLRFAGAGRAKRISGTLSLGDARARFVSAVAVGAPPESIKVAGGKIELALTTSADAPVGVDLRVDPPNAPLAWEIYVDDGPLTRVFAGPFGFAAPSLAKGMTSDEARAIAYSPSLPEIDPSRDDGLFVTRARPGEVTAPVRELSPEGAEEMTRLLKEWGYARAAAAAAATPSATPKPNK